MHTSSLSQWRRNREKEQKKNTKERDVVRLFHICWTLTTRYSPLLEANVIIEDLNAIGDGMW